MTIDSRMGFDGVMTLYMTGSVNYNTSPILRDAIASVPDSVRQLVLDFRDVNYITSAGLRELLVCRHRFPGDRLRIVNVIEEVMEVFRIVSFDAFLPIEPMQEDLNGYLYHSFKEILASRVEESRDRVALKSAWGDYTWEQVEMASQIIAGDLSALGVKAGTHVGLCGLNSANWLLLFCAAQKLGALTMLINPNQTAGEIGRVCALGDVDCLCYGEMPAMEDEAAFLERLRRAEGCRVRSVYSFRNGVDYRARFSEYAAQAGKFLQWVDPDAPSVVIFTSGSTGRPKGVILSSFNLFNAAATQAKLMRMKPDDKELLIVPLFHILGLAVCLYPCLLENVPMVIPGDIHANTLIRVMERERCTLMHSVPTLVLAILGNRGYDPRAFESMRCTYLAGAPVSEAHLRVFEKKMPNNHFMIAYGLSEMAPVSVTLYEDTDEHLLQTVGKPVRNVRVKVLDRQTGGECGVGEVGEVLVQGLNLMTGYYKLPIDQQSIDGEGWLHTGDMGAIDEDGYLSLRGRYKELIIRGGENILPAEVEAAVGGLDGVADVKAVGVPSAFFGEEVAACVQLKPGARWDEALAREQLAQSLARFKIPRWFFLYREFPMLDSGKIDALALKRDAAARALEHSQDGRTEK